MSTYELDICAPFIDNIKAASIKIILFAIKAAFNEPQAL